MMGHAIHQTNVSVHPLWTKNTTKSEWEPPWTIFRKKYNHAPQVLMFTNI